MICKDKDRVIVSIPKTTIAILDKIVVWYNDTSYRGILVTRSIVIDDLIQLFSEKIGIK